MQPYRYRLRTAFVAAILMVIAMSACQTDGVAQRHFPPEKRLTFHSGGPHNGSAETMEVVFGYSYTIGAGQLSDNQLMIEGSISRFKIKPDFLVLHINLLDAQVNAVENRLIYTLKKGAARDSYFRSSPNFASELQIPDGTAFYAFSSFSRMSRGRK